MNGTSVSWVTPACLGGTPVYREPGCRAIADLCGCETGGTPRHPRPLSLIGDEHHGPPAAGHATAAHAGPAAGQKRRRRSGIPARPVPHAPGRQGFDGAGAACGCRGRRRFHLLLQQVRQSDRRSPEGRRVHRYFPHLCRAGIGDVGDTSSPDDIATALRRAGYNENSKNTTGLLRHQAAIPSISFPARIPTSIRNPPPSVFRTTASTASFLCATTPNGPRYELEPQLVTNLHDRNREKQRPVRYEDIPPILRDAILSAEDKRFFSHPGFDPIGIVRSAWVDMTHGREEQGASTLTMQLARYMFLRSLERLEAQGGRNDDHAAAGTEAHQAADFRALLQSGGPGTPRQLHDSRFRRSFAGVFRQGHQVADACRRPPLWRAC